MSMKATMKAINGAAKALNQYIDSATTYLKANAFPILALLGAYYVYKTYYSKNSSGYTLSGSTANATSTARTTTTTTKKTAGTPTSRDEDLRQVRLKQQEIADERARLAAILRTQKQQAERDRKNHVALEKKKLEGGDALGGESTSKKTYNALQPLAASSTGYRPARRTVRRG